MKTTHERPRRNIIERSSERIGEHVTIYLRGKTWWASYQLDRRQQRESLQTNNVKEARRQGQIIELELHQGQRAAPMPQVAISTAIAEYLQYLKVEGRAAKTLNKYEHVWETMLDAARQRHITNLSQLNLRFIDHYRSLRKAAGNAPLTIHNETTIIRQMVNFALSRRMVAKDPLEGLKNPKPRSPKQPCWSPEEMEQILVGAKEPQASIYLLLADTGMRIGEVEWLTWEDIDFDRGLIHIQAKDDWKPKSGDARTINMTPRVRAMLEHRSRKQRWVFCAARSRKYPAGDQQISERRLLRSLKRLLKRIGLPTAGKLHTFRHSFISKALSAGITNATVRAWVGHVSEKILAIYTHVLDGQSQQAMQRFAAATPPVPPITDLPQSKKGSQT
jgi:site-specific recombinase XerD